MARKPTLHLIANSHLDPVWLWDWREGLTETLATVRSVVRLMERYPELTYIRGESLVYEHVLKEDPATFDKILELHGENRWDVVGGSYLQADTNLPATETLVRQYEVGQRFFMKHFGQRVEVAWQADSFGHSAGLPAILNHAGIRNIAFFRPHEAQQPLASPAFWWRTESGPPILAYRPPVAWYGCERDEMTKRLDLCLRALESGPLTQIACFYGLGNHGGGPSGRHVEDIRAWSKAHPEVEVVHSGLHRFFDSLRESIVEKKYSLPTWTGELNFCLRGCYSATSRIKHLYRKAESFVSRLEKSASAWSLRTGQAPEDFDDLWRDVLFNAFHDILPGTMIERVTDEQVHWLGRTLHETQKAEFRLLNRMAEALDTSVPSPPEEDMPQATPLLVYNPHPFPYDGLVECDINLDYRPLFDYEGRPEAVPVVIRDAHGGKLVHQRLAETNQFLPLHPWRTHRAFRVQIPPMGWGVYTCGLEQPEPSQAVPDESPFVIEPHSISNRSLCISAIPGESGIRIEYQGAPLLSEPGLSLVTMRDPWGSWGGHFEEPESIEICEQLSGWKITQVSVTESGPLRATLLVRLAAGSSQAQIAFQLTDKEEAVFAQVRVFWAEKAARLKMLMPGVDKARFEVPGGTVERVPSGEVPGQRWVWGTSSEGRGFGFASDALYNFSIHERALTATLVRTHPYASTEKAASGEFYEDSYPVDGPGEYRFRFLLTPQQSELDRLATCLEEPVYVQNVAPSAGYLPRCASIMGIEPERHVRLLALAASDEKDQWNLRLQNLTSEAVSPTVTIQAQAVHLPPLPTGALRSYRLRKISGDWKAFAVETDPHDQDAARPDRSRETRYREPDIVPQF